MPCLTKSARSSKVMNVCVAVLYSRRSGYFLMITGFWAFAITNENPVLHVRGLSFVRGFPSASPTPSARNAATDLRKVWPRRRLQERLVPFVPRAAYYGFGEVRVATLALLIFTALSG